MWLNEISLIFVGILISIHSIYDSLNKVCGKQSNQEHEIENNLFCLLGRSNKTEICHASSGCFVLTRWHSLSEKQHRGSRNQPSGENLCYQVSLEKYVINENKQLD